MSVKSDSSFEARLLVLIEQLRAIRKPFQEEAKQRERCREELVWRRQLELQAQAQNKTT